VLSKFFSAYRFRTLDRYKNLQGAALRAAVEFRLASLVSPGLLRRASIDRRNKACAMKARVFQPRLYAAHGGMAALTRKDGAVWQRAFTGARRADTAAVRSRQPA
jgi:hypothetical protein